MKSILVVFGSSLAFLSYCIYFDYKRRNASDFKRKLLEKRRKKREESKCFVSLSLPDLSDAEAVNRFFMQELQLGETLLSQDNPMEGIQHLATAIAICGQPTQMLHLFKESLPAQLFSLLLDILPSIQEHVEQVRKTAILERLSGKISNADVTSQRNGRLNAEPLIIEEVFESTLNSTLTEDVELQKLSTFTEEVMLEEELE